MASPNVILLPTGRKLGNTSGSGTRKTRNSSSSADASGEKRTPNEREKTTSGKQSRPTGATRKSSAPETGPSKTNTAKGSERKGESTTGRTGRRSSRASVLATTLSELQGRMPVLFDNSKMHLPEGKLGSLNLLDDTLMSLSLTADSLQRKVTGKDEMHAPETITAMCLVSKEIRSLVQLKLEMAKELARLEFEKIRMAIKIENHQRNLNGGEG